MGFLGRQSVFDPEPNPIPTLFVLAHKTQANNSDWLSAAKQIHRGLLGSGFQNVQVELADPEAFRLPTCSPVLETDSIFPLWDVVCRKILDSSSNLQKWNALECFRYGKHDDASLNPPTIVLSVPPTSSKTNWKTVRNSILQILLEFGLWDVGVSIIPNKIIRQCDSDFSNTKSHCREKAQAGLSVGLNNSQTKSGTLGGFLELKFDGEDTWRKFGVTCFHVAYTPTWLAKLEHDYLSQKWYRSPVLPGDPAARALQMTQPGLFDLANAIKAVERKIAESQTPKFREVEAAMLADDFVMPGDKRFYNRTCQDIQSVSKDKAFTEDFIAQNKMYLGHVFSGSGFQRVKSSTSSTIGSDPHDQRSAILDWALIQIVPERDTDDRTICPYGEFPFSPFDPNNIDAMSMYTGNPGNCDTLHKAGRTTEYTKGIPSGLMQEHIAKEIVNGHEVVRVTMEHAVCGVGEDRIFSGNGDSGSFVLSETGEVVGMLFAGSEGMNVSYFTHIVDLVNDIKEVTGAVSVRLMGSDMAL